MLGELLYQLTARDGQTDWLEPVLGTKKLVTGAALSAFVFFAVPLNKILILTNFSARILPNALQTVSNSRVAVDDAQGNELTVIKRVASDSNGALGIYPNIVSAAAGDNIAYDWQGEIIIPSLNVLSFRAQFSGAAIHSVEFYYQGLLIPRGNVTI
jgi:hypothetical protein